MTGDPLSFPLELDHIGILVAPGAPELAGLEALGLKPLGEKTDHSGMGTAGTSIFFDNLYVELVWITNEEVAGNKWGGAGVDMTGRAPGGTALPFCIVLRARADGMAELPFQAGSVVPEWMDAGSAIRVAGMADEPLYMVIPEPLQYPAFRDNLPTPSHPLGVKRVTGVQVTVPGALTSIEKMLHDAHVVAFREGNLPLIEIVFDDGGQGKSADARPILPLLMRY